MFISNIGVALVVVGVPNPAAAPVPSTRVWLVMGVVLENPGGGEGREAMVETELPVDVTKQATCKMNPCIFPSLMEYIHTHIHNNRKPVSEFQSSQLVG